MRCCETERSSHRPKPTKQEAETSSQEERRPREGADDGVDCVAGALWPTAISTEPRCTQLTPSSAERARRERRHPKASTAKKSLALDPLENEIRLIAQIAVMSGRRPVVKGCFEAACERLGRGHVYGLLMRKDVSAGPDDLSAWLFAPSFARARIGADRYSGFQAFSVGSHHFVGALDVDRLRRRKLPIE